MEKRRKIRGDDPNLNRMKKPKGYRAIEVNGREMFWMTDGFVVIIKDIRKSIEITTSELMGYPRNPIERHVVTPYDIKSYIDENWSQFA
jgi:hypothetical protein